MAQLIPLEDSHALQDALTFIGRAARVSDEGVRLQAGAGVLRMSTATLAPRGLLDATPIVLGMRIMATDPELECDVVVSAGALQGDAEGSAALQLPETAMLPAWAGVAPPQLGWENVGSIPGVELLHISALGIEEVNAAMPADPGEDVVRSVRSRIWAPQDDMLGGAPRGAAFAADALGFARASDRVEIFRADRWTRLSSNRGHIISRGPARTGMTEVRRTGAAS